MFLLLLISDFLVYVVLLSLLFLFFVIKNLTTFLILLKFSYFWKIFGMLFLHIFICTMYYCLVAG